jgi:hypothetical protein
MEITKKKYKLVHLYPPGFVTINGQKYMVPGWTPVEPDTTFSDVEHINPWKTVTETFPVKGSTGSNYTVTKRKDVFTCDCPAGKFRGTCKHIGMIKSELKLG